MTLQALGHGLGLPALFGIDAGIGARCVEQT